MISRTILRSIAKARPAAARNFPPPRIASGPAIAYHQSFSSSSRTLQEVKYVRFGQSGSEGGNKWRPFQGGKWDTPSKLLMGAVAAASGYYVYHLERVEETGRWRFIDVSPEQERAIGQESDEEVLRQFRGKILPASDPRTRQVARVANRIITAANLGEVKGEASTSLNRTDPWSTGADTMVDDWQGGGSATQKSAMERLRQEWQVFVINDDDTPNAFVTGGGKIFVFTGILPIAKNDDGLATVLGHEIAHQVERHSAEKMSGMKVFTALVVLLEVLGLDIGISRVGLTLAMTLPNSRTMESEADQVGLRLMSQACFDPRESVRMWERFSELEKKKGGGGWFSFGSTDFLETHPASEKRIKALSDQVPRALSVRAASSCAIDDSRSVPNEFAAFRVVLPVYAR